MLSPRAAAGEPTSARRAHAFLRCRSVEAGSAEVRRWTLIAVCVTTFVLLLDITIVVVGGILTDGLGWRWIFFVNVPVGAFALVIARTRMVESRDPGAVRTDLAGLVTFSAALLLIVFGLLRGNSEGWSSAVIVSALV